MSPQWDPVKNPVTPTRVHFNFILSSTPNVFHMVLSFQAKTCVISVIYAACRAPEVLGIISIVLIHQGDVL